MVQLASQHPECQRQIAAQASDTGYRRMVRVDVLPVGEPHDKLRGIVRLHRVEADRLGIL